MLRFILITYLIISAGCMANRVVGVEDQSEALRQVDQGTLYLRQRDLDKAEASFRVANETVPTLASALDGLGCVAFLRGNYKDAEEYFWRAYEVDSSYNNSLGNLALLYETTGDKQKAAQLYSRALQEDPRNFRARNNYAGFLVSSGNNQKIKRAQDELLKAKMLLNHPLISRNLENLDYSYSINEED